MLKKSSTTLFHWRFVPDNDATSIRMGNTHASPSLIPNALAAQHPLSHHARPNNIHLHLATFARKAVKRFCVGSAARATSLDIGFIETHANTLICQRTRWKVFVRRRPQNAYWFIILYTVSLTMMTVLKTLTTHFAISERSVTSLHATGKRAALCW